MNIPKRLKIGGHDVDVLLVDEIPLKAADLGCTQICHRKIWISRSYQGDSISEPMQVETLLHEILHFILVQAGYGPRESIVTAASSGLFQVIRDNHLDFLDKGRGK